MALLPQQSVRVSIPEPLPPIITPKLYLRPLADSDAEGLFAIRSRPEVARTNYPKTPHRTVQETREWMATKIFKEGPESVLGRRFTYVLIEREQWEDESQPPPADKQVIGYMGINQIYPSPEIGYSIHPDYWGKGYATEALDGLLKAWWKLPRQPQLNSTEDGSEPTEKVFAFCDKINAGSSKVLSKCGFRVIKQVEYDTDELWLWELERPVLGHTCP
ncbi:hypothetical protein Asppvi_005516 [Aspergillus pseudoviridinutans]|uniref:N-acetyltransferase domain-containing protein n=1 Tax=Aspergillus pseudoviridinutans TaxID=1517512 RepID=A0A9P3BC56_9EURO|nr:uncharacterized protein Asppvi_005516 [Aspergillus pseudoviridinutans]GIJ86625.1 hypothetical protein Asppvi_005516 [Aspergillus pseudoviridinutans]